MSQKEREIEALYSMLNVEQIELFENLVQVYNAGQTVKRNKFNRYVSFADILVDRVSRAELMNFGKGASIYDNVLVLGNVSVGENTWIGPNAILDGSGGLDIGAHCSVSAGVQIYSHDSVAWATSGGKASYEYSQTSIGDNCYIGPNSIIAKGVTVGKGATVGANSFVNADVGSAERVAGNPARIID